MPLSPASQPLPYLAHDGMVSSAEYSEMAASRHPQHLNSVITAGSSNESSFPLGSSPGTPLFPQLQNRGNRIQHLGRKLAFWKKKPTCAKDVHSAFQLVAKSHEKYQCQLRNAMTTMRQWTDYLSPPSLLTQDLLQHQMIDVNLSQWVGSILDSIFPVIDMERKQGEILVAMVHSLEAMKKEEAVIKHSVGKQCTAEKRYFRAMASNGDPIENHQLDQDRTRLAADVDNATYQFRSLCRRELPLRFHQFFIYYENLEKELCRASTSLEHLLNFEDYACYGNKKTSLSCSLRCSPLDYMSSPLATGYPVATEYPAGLRPGKHSIAPQPCHAATPPIREPEEEDKISLEKTKTSSLSFSVSGLGSGFIWE